MSAVLGVPAAPVDAWRRSLGALVLLLAGIVVLYLDTFAAMARIWMRSDTFAHAVLVPPIVLWLAWRRRAALGAYTPGVTLWALAPMAVAAFFWLLGDMAGVNAVTQLAVTAMLVLSVPLVLGLAVAQQLLFPLAFLFFMVPIGEFMLAPMMEWTASFTVAAVRASGVPVYREGLNFVIPSGSWSVVEACSGVRYLIASFMVGTLFGYLNYRSNSRRWVFAGVAILVPVVANWVRAYLIVMLGHLSGNKLAVGVDHLIYGWVFFGAVILVMFALGARWSEPRSDLAPTTADRSRQPPAATPHSPWLAVALAAAVLVSPAAARSSASRTGEAHPLRLTLADLPGADMVQALPELSPSFPGAALVAEQGYLEAEGDKMVSIGVHVAYYRHQDYGAKLTSSSNMLVSPTDLRWGLTNKGSRTVEVQGRPVTMSVLEYSSGAAVLSARRRVEARQIYWIAGQFTSNAQWATALGLWSRLSGRGDDGAILSFSSEGEAELTGARLDSFIGKHLPALQERLEKARAAGPTGSSSTPTSSFT